MAEESPYKTWLNLPTDTPNYYQLLGIRVGESNLDTIKTAAANVRRTICSARPAAEQVAGWSALLSQLEEAETTLSDVTARTAYDQSLGIVTADAAIPMAVPVNSPPPPPAAATVAPMGTVYQPTAPTYAPGPTAATSAPLPDPMAPVGRPVAPAVHSATPTASTTSTAPVSSVPATQTAARSARMARQQKHRKRAERSLPIYLAIGAVAMATLAGIVIALQGPKSGSVARAPQGTTDSDKAPNTTAGPQPTKAPTSQPAPKTRAAASDVAVAAPHNPTEAAKPNVSDPAEAAVGIVDDGAGDTKPMTATTEPNTEPADNPQTGSQPDSADADSQPEPAPEPTAPTPSTSNPPSQPSPVSDVEIAALNARMTEIRGLLTMGEIDRAKQQLEGAVSGSSQQMEQWSRLQMAADLIGQFHEGVRRSLADFGSLAEIDIGPAKVVVVELRSEDIIIRANGQNRTYALKQMPWALALGLTTNILPDDQPENKVVKAMYLAVHHQRNAKLADQARALLQEAIAAGADGGMLVDFIDDQYGDGAMDTRPASPSPSPTPPAPANPAEAKAMQELLDKVADDFGKNNLEAAAKRLAAAEPMPATDAQRAMLARLNKVAGKLTSFHEAVQAAANGLKPDDEISISSSVTAKILEVTQTKLRIELSEDLMHTIDRKQMPPALAVELAKREMGDSAEAKVAAALFVRYHPSATTKYKEQARTWLEESGQDSDLLPLYEAL